MNGSDELKEAQRMARMFGGSANSIMHRLSINAIREYQGKHGSPPHEAQEDITSQDAAASG